MYCQSCRGTYRSGDRGVCNNCFQREIEELKAQIAFLRFWSPLDPRNQPSHTDVVLLAQDGASGSAVPILAHKAVLVNRSPVFKAMLENEMEENQSATIKISDASYDALCAFINYMYTGEVSLEEEMACELLELAEKYEVKHLKSYCDKFLVSKLNWDNSIMSYVFAHQHNAKHLLRATSSLIADNMSNFTKRDEYMELVEKEPRLVVEIYEVYLSKQVNVAAQMSRSQPHCYSNDCFQTEIEELKAQIAFLRFRSPLDPRNQPSHTDIVLLAQDEASGSAVPIRAHKAVLVNRSPVFKAMLENEMEEKRSGTIRISDASYDALCAFINYMYTGEVSLEEKMDCELLELAEKYEVRHLKAYCEKFLVSKLNWDNSIISYVFAHQHNAKHLLRAASSLIADNMSNFTKRDEYMVLVEKEPRLVVEIYEVYLSKQVNAAAQMSHSHSHRYSIRY